MAKGAPGEAGAAAGRGAGPRRLPAGLAVGLWGLTLLGLAATVLLDRRLRQAGFPELASSVAAGAPELVAAVSAGGVGAVLASRRPRHPVGWLLLGLGLAISAHAATFAYTRYGLVARPGSLPGADYLAGPHNGTVFVYLSVAGFVLLLTPTGALPSPRWRWWARLAAAAPVVGMVAATLSPRPLFPEYPGIGNPLFVPALEAAVEAAFGAGAMVVLASLVVAAASLVLRFRRARGVERLQLRWLALAAALAVVALLVTILASGAVSQAAIGLCVALLPLATGAAILRYRLYDLDRIISRTVAYGLLTLLLGLGYAAVVLGLGRLLPQGSSLAVAAATLAMAAAFQPARRRLQRAMDRRFNRRRHDAAQTIASFGARLREQVDLDTLHAELLGVVDQTMQPTRASLWLRGS